ncbi:hypothetical protein ACPU8A_001499, partial [Salmonella enterica subsp. enterica serovar Infantis]
EQLHERARRKVKELEFAITQSAFTSIRDGLNDELELARIALAALEAAPDRLCQSPSVFGRPFLLLRAQIV